MNKRETHIVQGMTRDITNHRFSSSMVFDARNIRISARDGVPTLLSVTNEKGTSEFPVAGDTIQGTVIGTAVINNQLVLFCVNGTDNWIYLLTFNEEFTGANCTTLYEGNDLGMDYLHPLETMPIYENENIQKVYWVDGKNQPRMINIVDILNRGKQTTGDIFNFNREISPDYSLLVEKFNGGGHFPPGTIQYCFNYFNKFGQETNIVDVSPLYYLSPKENGLPADAVSNSSFKITLSDLDSNFDYVRVYSIIRTSENATPNVRILGDYRIQVDTKYNKNIEDAAEYGSDLTVPYDSLFLLNFTDNTLENAYEKFGVISEPSLQELGNEIYLFDSRTNKIYWYQGSIGGKVKKGPAVRMQSDGDSYTIFSSTATGIFKLMEGIVTTESSITRDVIITDNGSLGSTLDATALLFIGGQEIIAGTFTKKDNTLFLGNIQTTVPTLEELKDSVKDTAEPCIFGYEGNELELTDLRPSSSDVTGVQPDGVSGKHFYEYPIDNNRNSYQIKTFKARENYRLGFVAQYKTGQWSEVLWVGDETETYAPGRNVFNLIRPVGQEYDTLTWMASYRNPGFKATIPSNVVNALLNKGFQRIVPVVVYPNLSDRLVLYQGLLAGTVFNVRDRSTNSPYAQADWRFRIGYNWKNIENEIQTNPYKGANTLPAYQSAYQADYVERFKNEYYRDANTLTFHSPDIEFADTLYQGDFDRTKLRIVGISCLGFDNQNQLVPASSTTDVKVFLGSQSFDSQYAKLFDHTIRTENFNSSLLYVGYQDKPCYEITDGDNAGVVTGSGLHRGWLTYLWHRSGSMHNQPALSSAALSKNSLRYALLSKKLTSEFQYARTTFFQNINTRGPEYVNLNTNTLKLINADSQMSQFNVGALKEKVSYYSNVDKVIVPNFKNNSDINITLNDGTNAAGIDASGGYPILIGYKILNYSGGNVVIETEPDDEDTSFVGLTVDGYYFRYLDEAKYKGKDPVELKYKTPRHIVFSLSGGADELPQLSIGQPQFNPFWDYSVQTKNVLNGAIEGFTGFSGFENSVYVAEIYRDSVDMNSRFGGNSQEAIANNVWTRCGESVKLVSGEAATLYYREGDTYVGRYDCLKSYPVTNEDTNQFVSIYSTEVESRVNLDFRYDNNRGQQSNLYVRPNNFNLFNHPGYEQTNQYFTFKGLDYDRYVKNAYPTTITWSLEKKLGEDIDTWTSITLTATADADGSLGEVTRLASLNDTIFSFQNRGFARILFNERVQIPTSDNTPIEITNGLKFGGLQYLSKHVGITNKWACCETINGLYFVDDESNALYKYANQLENLSTKFGFDTWFTNNNSYKIWNPVDYANIRAFYDKVNSDIYFMTKDESLVFSEKLNTFTSFMDYAHLSAMVGVNDKFFTFTENDNHIDTMWQMFGGNYNSFFGTYKPYWLTFVSNDDPTIDKVFNNLAWRSEVYDANDEYKPFETFDTLKVWHEHQDTGEVALQDIPAKSSILKKKMNVFRTYVPRNKKRDWLHSNMDRIRNTWAKIQLKKTSENTDRQEFFDLDVNYFE